jgi:molecular chaperone GrpE
MQETDKNNLESTGSPEAADASEKTTPPPSAPLSQAEIEQLKARATKADEHWERLMRLMADFDNYKKRIIRERQDDVKYAARNLLEKLLPIMDNFEMALNAARDAKEGSSQSLLTGVEMIIQQLHALLKEANVETIDGLGKPFDPNFHEAVSQIETADTPEGHVVMQLRKGYKLHDRLLRPATVIVAKAPADSKPAS